MDMLLSILLHGLLIAVPVCGEVIFMPQNDFQPVSGKSYSFPVDLSPLFNNRGFGMTPNESNFDGHRSSTPFPTSSA